MPTRGKPLYTYSIRATLSSRSSRTCSRNYSGLLPKCPPTCAGTPATPRVFSHAGRGLPYFSYARSAGVLQQERHMGGRAQPARPVRTTWAHAADLRSGHLAWGERTRVPASGSCSALRGFTSSCSRWKISSSVGRVERTLNTSSISCSGFSATRSKLKPFQCSTTNPSKAS